MERLSFQALPVLNWLFESTIYISILICLIFIIKAFTKRRLPAWWSYFLWLLLLVRMLIPVVVETPVGVFNYFPAPPENSSYIRYLMPHPTSISFIQNAPDSSPYAVPPDADLSNKSSTESHDTHETATTNTSGFDLSFDKALMLLWLAGVLAFGIATVYKNCKFRLGVRREQPVTDKDILELFNECRSTLGLQKKVKIIVTDSVKSPAIYGYFKPQLLLPTHFLDTLNKDELYCIFLHELSHVKRHDIGVSWLATLFQVIYWFNPLVWYAFHYLRADQEAACDAYVLSKIKKAQPTDYARTIVNLLERFVQNRQLPSLAGIIENKSQIGRRISMILEYKKITQKMTLISVLMLFMAACVFFSFSNGRLADQGSSQTNVTQSENSDMKHYKSEDWNFSLDLPKHWAASASLPADISGGAISFGSNDNGLEALRIFMVPHDPELSLNEERNSCEKELTGEGYGNFIGTETMIGSKKALILDFDKKVENGTRRDHLYLIPYHSILYGLDFISTRPDASFELYDRIAKTFEFHEPPVVEGIKKYLGPDGNIAMEIPANWKTLPPKINEELIRFGTPQNGLTALIYNLGAPWKSLEDTRTLIQTRATKIWKDFTNSETIINGRKTLIVDCNNGSTSIRGYLFENGNYRYLIVFFGGTKKGMPADMLEEYGRIMKSINFIKVNAKDDEFERKGGTRLILQIGTNEVVTQELDQVAQNIARDLKSKKIAFDSSKRGNGFVINVSGIDSTFFVEAEDYLQNVFKQNYDIQSKIAEGRTDFTLVLQEAQIRAIRESTVRQAMETLRRRMTEMSLSNPRVRLSDKNNQGIKDQIIVEFPDVDGPERVKALLSNTAQLTVCLVHDKYNAPFSSLESAVNTLGKIPEGYQLLPYGVADRNSPAQFILVRIDPVITSKDIKTARGSMDQNGSPAISFFLTADGGDRFAQATSEHIGRKLAIVLNGTVYSAPTINEKIGSEGMINGKFTQQAAEDLALLLRSGALPASVRILQEIHVPPADR
jgi:protein-export membrane protein SecD